MIFLTWKKFSEITKICQNSLKKQISYLESREFGKNKIWAFWDDKSNLWISPKKQKCQKFMTPPQEKTSNRSIFGGSQGDKYHIWSLENLGKTKFEHFGTTRAIFGFHQKNKNVKNLWPHPKKKQTIEVFLEVLKALTFGHMLPWSVNIFIYIFYKNHIVFVVFTLTIFRHKIMVLVLNVEKDALQFLVHQIIVI